MNDLALHFTGKMKYFPSPLTTGKLLQQTVQVKKERREGKVCNDEKWVQACLNGDQTAFAQIIELYQAYVFAIILNFVDERDASDVAQEVFLQMYRSLPQYEPDNFKAWIGKIAARKAIDWKKKHQRMASRLPDIDLNNIRDRSVPLPDEFIIREESRQQVQNLCRRLPARYGRIIIKYYYEHKSYQQIAREEDINVRTVETRLYRGRNLIRQQWLLLKIYTSLQEKTGLSLKCVASQKGLNNV